MEPHTPPDQQYTPPDGFENAGFSELDVANKEKHLRLFKRGLSWMAAGVGIMGFSFMLQFLLFQADDRSFIVPMYILTSLGAIAVMKGLGDAFGF